MHEASVNTGPLNIGPAYPGPPRFGRRHLRPRHLRNQFSATRLCMRAANKPGQNDGALNRMLSRNCVLAVGVPMDLRITFHFSSSFSPVGTFIPLSHILHRSDLRSGQRDKISDSSGSKIRRGIRGRGCLGNFEKTRGYISELAGNFRFFFPFKFFPPSEEITG